MQTDINELLRTCLAPSSPHGNDFGPSEKDFSEFKATIDNQLMEVNSEIDSRISTCHPCLEDIEFLSLVVILRGEHSSSSLWTTECSSRISDDIYQKVSSHYEATHNRPLYQDPKVLKTALRLLRPKLLAATFRSNPAAIVCYSWFLHKMQSSTMSNFLQDLLPTALIIADDYEPKNIKLGLECLHHIIENVAIEKLKWYGYNDVIMDVLKKCMYLKEPDIVSAHLMCFASLMSSSLRHNASLKRNSFDEIINSVLVNMYLEQNLGLRRIYASCISDLIEARGLGVVRHLSMLMKILSEYTLESSTTNYSLKALAKTIKVCWCRGDSFGKNALVILMKLLIVASRTPSHIDYSKVSPEVRLVADLLSEAFPAVVKQFLDDMNKNRTSLDKNLVSLVEDIFGVTSHED